MLFRRSLPEDFVLRDDLEVACDAGGMSTDAYQEALYLVYNCVIKPTGRLCTLENEASVSKRKSMKNAPWQAKLIIWLYDYLATPWFCFSLSAIFAIWTIYIGWNLRVLVPLYGTIAFG